MLEWKPPNESRSAGAMTMAKRIGVSSGTTISRGVRVLSANLRRERVATADMVDMWILLVVGSGCGGDPGAGEPQVDVVEARLTRAQRGHGQAQVVDRADGVRGGVL